MHIAQMMGEMHLHATRTLCVSQVMDGVHIPVLCIPFPHLGNSLTDCTEVGLWCSYML